MTDPPAPTQTGLPDLVITRTFDAPRDLIFRMWTDPRHLAAWWGPRGTHTPPKSVSVDLRLGGEWAATMVVTETGETFPVRGVYRTIDPPERLAFDWLEDGTGAGGIHVSVSFVEVDGRTEMTLRSGMTRFDIDHDAASGWSSSFDRFAAHLAAIQHEQIGAHP